MNRKNRKKQLSKDDLRAVGFDFIEFLTESERRSITERSILKDIYNDEFRNSVTFDMFSQLFKWLLFVLLILFQLRSSYTEFIYKQTFI